MLIARRGDLWALGGTWAGDMAGGKFWGEVLPSQRAKQTVVGAIDPTEADGMMASAALSGDYTFPGSLYLHVNQCLTALGLHTMPACSIHSTGPRTSVACSLVALAEVSYDITPLVRGSVSILHNPTDGSSVYVPVLVVGSHEPRLLWNCSILSWRSLDKVWRIRSECLC